MPVADIKLSEDVGYGELDTFRPDNDNDGSAENVGVSDGEWVLLLERALRYDIEREDDSEENDNVWEFRGSNDEVGERVDTLRLNDGVCEGAVVGVEGG